MVRTGAKSRRQLLHGAAGGALFTALWSCRSPLRSPGIREGGPRRRLDEAAPMLPPVPAVLLSVNGLEGGLDELSVVWTFVVNGAPPQVGVSVAHEHVAQARIERHGQFVLNVPCADLVEAFDRVDMSSSRVADKYELSGLTRGTAVAVDAPTVEECPIQVECEVIQSLELPPMRRLFFASVAATTVHRGVCDDRGMLLVENVPFFGMTAGSGEFYTMGQSVGHIGATEGVARGRHRY